MPGTVKNPNSLLQLCGILPSSTNSARPQLRHFKTGQPDALVDLSHFTAAASAVKIRRRKLFDHKFWHTQDIANGLL